MQGQVKGEALCLFQTTVQMSQRNVYLARVPCYFLCCCWSKPWLARLKGFLVLESLSNPNTQLSVSRSSIWVLALSVARGRTPWVGMVGSLSVSPLPVPYLGLCHSSFSSKLSIYLGAHFFSPGHTGDSILGFLLLCQLTMVQGEPWEWEAAGFAKWKRSCLRRHWYVMDISPYYIKLWE